MFGNNGELMEYDRKFKIRICNPGARCQAVIVACKSYKNVRIIDAFEKWFDEVKADAKCEQTKAFTPSNLCTLAKIHAESLQRRKTFYETIETVSRCIEISGSSSNVNPFEYRHQHTHTLSLAWAAREYFPCLW